MAVILVDANTRPDTGMDTSNEAPSTASIISSVTGVQLKRYDAESKRLVKEKMAQWESHSTAEKPQKTHFISVSLQEISDPDVLAYFNTIPTSFRLDEEQVDRLIEAGRTLLRDNPGFRQLLADLENP
jgi:NTE family protein